jgi:hypothetical protein
MRTGTVWCAECDHEHECELVSEEDGDWLDVPEVCEACGERMAYDGGSDAADRAHERRQMGICD